jgi:tripartite-type tricarboxylate transporter receptor subunit TctC
MRIRYLLLTVCFSLSFPPVTFAQEFYKGKTIRVIVGASAGGGFDMYTRALARHMPKHIPGNPTLVVENMTGRRLASPLNTSTAVPNQMG